MPGGKSHKSVECCRMPPSLPHAIHLAVPAYQFYMIAGQCFAMRKWDGFADRPAPMETNNIHAKRARAHYRELTTLRFWRYRPHEGFTCPIHIFMMSLWRIAFKMFHIFYQEILSKWWSAKPSNLNLAKFRGLKKLHWEKTFDWIKENNLFERLSLI